jgi:hypothetical protein
VGTLALLVFDSDDWSLSVCLCACARVCALNGSSLPSPHLLDARSAHTWRVCEPQSLRAERARQSVRETVCASVRACVRMRVRVRGRSLCLCLCLLVRACACVRA